MTLDQSASPELQERIRQRATTLSGFAVTSWEQWDALTNEERLKVNLAWVAACWLEDYKQIVDLLAEMTGESRELITAFYFGLEARRAALWIEGLQRCAPPSEPKEPWQQ